MSGKLNTIRPMQTIWDGGSMVIRALILCGVLAGVGGAETILCMYTEKQKWVDCRILADERIEKLEKRVEYLEKLNGVEYRPIPETFKVLKEESPSINTHPFGKETESQGKSNDE